MATVGIYEAGTLLGSVEVELALDADGRHLDVTFVAAAPETKRSLPGIVTDLVGAKNEGWQGKVFTAHVVEDGRTYEGCQIVADHGATQRVLFASSRSGWPPGSVA